MSLTSMRAALGSETLSTPSLILRYNYKAFSETIELIEPFQAANKGHAKTRGSSRDSEADLGVARSRR